MAKNIALVILTLVATGAAPLPPAVEKINREGITVAAEVTIHGSLSDKESEGTHLLKLHKGHAYAINLAGLGFKVSLRIEDPERVLLSMDSGQKTFMPT